MTTRSHIRNPAWGICLVLSAAAGVAWAFLPALDAAPLLRVALFLTCGISMLGLVFFFPDLSSKASRRLIIGAAILLRLTLLPAPVSDDVNRYLWEGELVRDGGNPYSAPADDPRWQDRRDATWQAMNHRDRPTAYPPGIQWIHAAASAVWPKPFTFKILALAGDLATLLILLALLRHHAAPLRWAGFYAFNPVVLIAFAAEGHFDSLMVAALLAALLAAARGKSSAWLWLGVAIQIKLVCLVLVPLFLTRKLIRGSGWLPLVLILPSLPFLSGLAGWLGGVGHFAGTSAFNGPLFTLLASTGLSLETVRLAGTLAFAASALTICIARWRGMPLVDAALWMLGSLLVCSPIVHFWYLAWLLPLASIRPSFAWTALSVSMGGYFIAWWTQDQLGWWGFGHGVAACIWLPWLLAGLAQHRSLLSRFRASAPVPEPFRPAVVLPVLNAGPGLAPLIRSLRSEMGHGPEIIVADGGSHDGSARASSDARLISAPRGRGNQIAAGISATDATWILIAHADSIPHPGWLADLELAIRKNPDASLLIFGQRFDSQGPGTLLVEALNEMRVVFGGVAFGDQTMVLRRSALEAAGGFPAQPLMEDVEVSLRLAGQGRVVYLGREWSVSSRNWASGFGSRFLLVIRLVASYQLARLKSKEHAAAVSQRMYRDYYPESPASG